MIFQLAPSEMIAGLLAPVATLFIVGVGYGRVVRRIAERRQQRLAESVQRAEERLGGIRTVRTFNAEKSEVESFEKLLDAVYQAGWQNALAWGGLSSFFVTGGGLFLIHIIYNCGVMVTSGVVSVGTTVSLAMYCFMAGSSYTGIMTAYGDLVFATEDFPTHQTVSVTDHCDAGSKQFHFLQGVSLSEIAAVQSDHRRIS